MSAQLTPAIQVARLRLPKSATVIVGPMLSICLLLAAAPATAQERYELVAAQHGIASQATLTNNELQVVGADGNATIYTRQPAYDSQGGEWIGYASRGAEQILRWPASNSGKMQIGEVRGNSVRYRYSQMSIRPVGRLPGRVADRPVLPPSDFEAGRDPAAGIPPIGLGGELPVSDMFKQLLARNGGAGRVEPRSVRIASFDGRRAPAVLSRGNGLELIATDSSATAGDWWISPAGAGMVRLQMVDRGRVYAVSSQGQSRVTLLPVAQDPRQLWRVTEAWGVDDRYILANGQFPGMCLTHMAGGHIELQPINFAAAQLWAPLVAPLAPSFQPFYRTVSQEVHANAQLPPAQLELDNSHRYPLIVLLGDNRAGADVQVFSIPAGGSQVVSLDRDAGSTLIETVELLDPLGGWQRQQFVTAIPPRAFYDLSVYAEHLQSIAIDRTGKSPNQIEDVNMVPKSVGWLSLPAGAALPSVGRMDVYQRAQAANNPGAVRRFDPRQFDAQPAPDRLEALLRELTPAAAPASGSAAGSTPPSNPPASPAAPAPSPDEPQDGSPPRRSF